MAAFQIAQIDAQVSQLQANRQRIASLLESVEEDIFGLAKVRRVNPKKDDEGGEQTLLTKTEHGSDETSQEPAMETDEGETSNGEETEEGA